MDAPEKVARQRLSVLELAEQLDGSINRLFRASRGSSERLGAVS